MLYGFVDVFTWAHNPYIIFAVDLEERDIKVQCLIYVCSLGGLLLTVLVLVRILWLDGQLTSLLLNHVCIRMACGNAQFLLDLTYALLLQKPLRNGVGFTTTEGSHVDE